MEPVVTVIKPGRRCRLVRGDRAEAVVLAVTIREGGVASYEIAWWVSGRRETAWVEAHEVEAASPLDQREIGFGG